MDLEEYTVTQGRGAPQETSRTAHRSRSFSAPPVRVRAAAADVLLRELGEGLLEIFAHMQSIYCTAYYADSGCFKDSPNALLDACSDASTPFSDCDLHRERKLRLLTNFSLSFEKKIVKTRRLLDSRGGGSKNSTPNPPSNFLAWLACGLGGEDGGGLGCFFSFFFF